MSFVATIIIRFLNVLITGNLSVTSPAGASQSEDQLYMDKLKQLSKYIEPLRRMINKIDKNEGARDFFF